MEAIKIVKPKYADYLEAMEEGDELKFDISATSGLRGSAISRELKYRRPDLKFTTEIRKDEKGVRCIYVRRLTKEEITQQQQSAVSAG